MGGCGKAGDGQCRVFEAKHHPLPSLSFRDLFPESSFSLSANSEEQTYPRLSTPHHSTPTTPRLWTQAQRTFGRDRFGFLMGRHGEGPKRTDGRMWTPGGATLPRRTGETRRGSEKAAKHSQQPPARDCRHKPKIPNAWGDDRFILTKPTERSSPHAVHPHSPRLTAVGRLRSGASRGIEPGQAEMSEGQP
jgi:hypothetical protein